MSTNLALAMKRMTKLKVSNKRTCRIYLNLKMNLSFQNSEVNWTFPIQIPISMTLTFTARKIAASSKPLLCPNLSPKKPISVKVLM